MTKVNELALQRAIKRRDDFLEENPHMMGFQKELDEMFKATGNDPFINIQLIKNMISFNNQRLETMAKLIRGEDLKIEKMEDVMKRLFEE